MQLYLNPSIQTVDSRNVPCRPLARPLEAPNPEWTIRGFTASDEASPDSAGGVDQRQPRMPPEVGRGGRCRRDSGFARDLGSGVGEARLQGKRRRRRWSAGRPESRCRGIGPPRHSFGQRVMERSACVADVAEAPAQPSLFRTLNFICSDSHPLTERTPASEGIRQRSAERTRSGASRCNSIAFGILTLRIIGEEKRLDYNGLGKIGIFVSSCRTQCSLRR